MAEHKHEWLRVQEMLTINGRRAVATCDHGCQLVGDKIIEELNKVAQLEGELIDYKALVGLLNKHRTPFIDNEMGDYMIPFDDTEIGEGIIRLASALGGES